MKPRSAAHAGLCLLALASSLWAGTTFAATLDVARDGSGDYTILADAVDAAAYGDTVTIAPGVYPEVRTYDTPGGAADFAAFVEIGELTVLGDGANSVIIGPESPAEDLERGPSGIICSTSGNVRVSGVTIRNLSIGVGGNGNWVEVEDCDFVGTYSGIRTVLTGMARVLRSKFFDCEDSGVLVLEARGATGALVEDCHFEGNSIGVDFQPPNCEMRDCSFIGGLVGAQVSFGGSAVIERCRFEENQNLGLGVLDGAQAHVTDCRFVGYSGTNILVAGHLRANRNLLEGGWWTTIEFSYPSLLAVNDNHILNGGGWSAWTFGAGTPIKAQDFTDNYWGTIDTAQIDAWIYDHNDDPAGVSTTVEYLPLAEGPIPTERTSFGELKARYGGQ